MNNQEQYNSNNKRFDFRKERERFRPKSFKSKNLLYIILGVVLSSVILISTGIIRIIVLIIIVAIFGIPLKKLFK